MPFEDSPQEILARCRDCVPVNELVGNTIAAHRIAFAEFQQYGGNDARRVAMYTLHAIVMAAAQSEEDDRTRLDYLSEVPETAWDSREDYSPQRYREDTLASIARHLALNWFLHRHEAAGSARRLFPCRAHRSSLYWPQSLLRGRADVASGTVKWFNGQKGYGFIQPEGGGKDVFVHISAVEKAGLDGLPDGAKVTYDIISDRGKESAGNLLLKWATGPPRRAGGRRSIRTREVSHGELDLAVGKLSPVLDNRHVPDVLTWLAEDIASFAAGRFDRQRKYFWLPSTMHPVYQIAGANEHVGPPSCILFGAADHERRCVKLKRGQRCG
jgi:cold shock protein